MNTNIDKKAFGITEVHTPVDLDESTISRYATQVALGSKLKEMLDGAVETEEPTVETEEPAVETEEPAVDSVEEPVETEETPVETEETPVETPQEEITVDEEGV